MKLDHSLTPYTKVNSKWIKDLKVIPENFWEGKQAEHSDKNCTNIFLDLYNTANKTKVKINEWKQIKLIKLLHSKGNHPPKEKTTYKQGENTCK